MQTSWILDQVPPSFAQAATILGRPSVAPSPYGPALRFDGIRDALIVHENPLRGAVAMTVEALFCPEAGGAFEQRFVHVQDDTADARTLLETRMNGETFYADTFIRCSGNELPLNDPKLLHACNRWHALALVYDGQVMRQYVDGQLELEGQIARQPFGSGRVAIGCRINEVFWYKGMIRQVRFSNHALPREDLLKP